MTKETPQNEIHQQEKKTFKSSSCSKWCPFNGAKHAPQPSPL